MTLFVAANEQTDIAALARGGRTNVFGFLLRLAARLPFLFIAGRLYGAAALGRFAAAIIVVEFAAQFATLGLKRGLAQELSRKTRPSANVVADALLLSITGAAVLAFVLWLFPGPMFPSGGSTVLEHLLPITILPMAIGDIALAALAYRFDVAATVRARAVVEPWTLSIAAGALYYVAPADGLAIAYVLSIFGATTTALVPLVRSYGLPRQWRPDLLGLGRLTLANLPLAGADAVEWGTRKLDIAILAQFAPPAAVGVYYVAQQIASLPQKLKTSFEPILGPVITRNLAENNLPAIVRQLCQVGFWITAAQAGIALALGISGKAVMGLIGPRFVGGTGAAAFLLLAEVMAAPAVVSEAALIYIAPIRNLIVSLATIVVQAALTVTFILFLKTAPDWDLPPWLAVDAAHLPLYQAAAVAAALALTLALASAVKSRLVRYLLGGKVSNWRWALVAAALPTIAIGWAAHWLPEWLELLAGIPAMLACYMAMIWRLGFGPEDRVLFRKAEAGLTG